MYCRVLGTTLLAASLALGCGGKTEAEITIQTASYGRPLDAAVDAREELAGEVSVDSAPESTTDARTPVRTSVGEPCTVDGDCGAGFRCVENACTRACVENADPLVEQLECGIQATCLLQGDPPAPAFCARSCDAAASDTGCRAGFVCTGFWFSRGTGMPDRAGCSAFCSADAHCPTGKKCNPRTGLCADRGVDWAKKPDGDPCTPAAGESWKSPGQACRGVCLGTYATSYTEGICASRVDTRLAAACPDDPAHVLLDVSQGDDSGLCWMRSCQTSCECTAPLLCVADPGSKDAHCRYPLASEHAAACADAGPKDASAD
jgi:hypothetical protein